MEEKLTSETRSHHTRNLVIRHQESLLPAHEHDSPVSTPHRQVGLAEFALDRTERHSEPLPVCEVALVSCAPACFGCEESKARADDFAIEVGR